MGKYRRQMRSTFLAVMIPIPASRTASATMLHAVIRPVLYSKSPADDVLCGANDDVLRWGDKLNFRTNSSTSKTMPMSRTNCP